MVAGVHCRGGREDNFEVMFEFERPMIVGGVKSVVAQYGALVHGV